MQVAPSYSLFKIVVIVRAYFIYIKRVEGYKWGCRALTDGVVRARVDLWALGSSNLPESDPKSADNS